MKFFWIVRQNLFFTSSNKKIFLTSLGKLLSSLILLKVILNISCSAIQNEQSQYKKLKSEIEMGQTHEAQL